MYLKGLPYSDAEGLSHLVSCLNEAIINDDPRIGEELKNWNFIDSVHIDKGEEHTDDRVGKIRICIICNDHYSYDET